MHIQPFTALTPDAVLDALDSIDLRGDGRLLALNSYENRVYQAGMEDSPPLVVKFYRPARCSDAGILEEHAFVATLAEREIPVVPHWKSTATRCTRLMAFVFPCSPNMADVRRNWTTATRWNGWDVSLAASMPSARWNLIVNVPR